MVFDAASYKNIKSKLQQKYRKRSLSLFRKLPETSNGKIVSWVMANQIEFNHFSSFNWYFLEQVKLFLFFKRQDTNLGKIDFGSKEEEVFERWNNSEFAREFLAYLNKGYHLGKASKLTLKHFEQHLLTLAQRHILKKKNTSKSYRPQTSLGEIVRKEKVLVLHRETLLIRGKELTLMAPSHNEMNNNAKKIKRALHIIRLCSPTSWERFKAFTDVIIPIKNPEFVSYSHQDLPGYSMINLYHRDFVDLMDDLLHENGHHHLNCYLNLKTLIEEPSDQIYYSPWRRTPRPLRGVYHAYFTFFWAFKLFADLITCDYEKREEIGLSKQEWNKVYFRASEEFMMLNFTFEELKWARKNDLIHDEGQDLINHQQKELLKYKDLISSWEKKAKTYRNELSDLKQTLKKAAKEFAKS